MAEGSGFSRRWVIVAVVILLLVGGTVLAPSDVGSEIRDSIEESAERGIDALDEWVKSLHDEPRDPSPRSDASYALGPNETGYDTEIDEITVEQLVSEFINEVRMERDLDPLTDDSDVANVSRAHSADMAERQYVGHHSPDGEGPQDRIDRAGVDCRVGENIAQTWFDRPVRTDDGVVSLESEEELATHLVTQWMDSPDHRQNILSEEYSSEGVGIVVTDDGQVFATQKFCAGESLFFS